MGRLLLICRLVVGDIKRRRVQSALLLRDDRDDDDHADTRLGAAQRHRQPVGAHPGGDEGPRRRRRVRSCPGAATTATRQFAPFRHAPGVAAIGGPFPLAFTRLTRRGINVARRPEGRDPTPAAVDQPLLTAGHWVRPGGAVIEQGLAEALGLT